MQSLNVRILCAVAILFAGIASPARADILVNKASGKRVLDAHSNDVARIGCKVQLWEFTDGNQQRWKIIQVGGGWVKIECEASGLVLDAHTDDVNVNACKVQLWTSAAALSKSSIAPAEKCSTLTPMMSASMDAGSSSGTGLTRTTTSDASNERTTIAGKDAGCARDDCGRILDRNCPLHRAQYRND
jgi:hypothetical protein